MYRKYPATKTDIKQNTSVEGETIEMRVERILNNNEPLTDGAPTIYTERMDGVHAEHNIRTDRFEIAIEASDEISKRQLAKREEFHKKLKKDNENPSETSTDKGTPPADAGK